MLKLVSITILQNENSSLKNGSPPPKKAKTFQSSEKVIGHVFLGFEGDISHHLFYKGPNYQRHYAVLLDKLKAAVTEEKFGIARKVVLFHQNNTPSHRSHII